MANDIAMNIKGLRGLEEFRLEKRGLELDCIIGLPPRTQQHARDCASNRDTSPWSQTEAI